jgi:hypothetical protein
VRCLCGGCRWCLMNGAYDTPEQLRGALKSLRLINAGLDRDREAVEKKLKEALEEIRALRLALAGIIPNPAL